MANTYLIAAVIWAAVLILPVLAVHYLIGLDDPGFWAAYVIWFAICGGLSAAAYVLHQRESRRQQ